jgi:DNA-binding XRE family transcriptional regulator
MNTVTLAQAHVEIPRESLRLFIELVTKLGGRLLKQNEEDSTVYISPPLHERERIGVLLCGARLRAGLTQKALAAAIGVPQSHISEYEKNKRPIPRAKAEELAKVLKTVPTHFLPKA